MSLKFENIVLDPSVVNVEGTFIISADVYDDAYYYLRDSTGLVLVDSEGRVLYCQAEQALI